MNGCSQETYVDHGSGAVHWDNIVLHAPKLPILPFNQRVLQTLWVACWTLKTCCAMTAIALIIAIAVPTCTCIRARYCLISGRSSIVSKPSFTAAKNPQIWIWTNRGKVRWFECELGIHNYTKQIFTMDRISSVPPSARRSRVASISYLYCICSTHGSIIMTYFTLFVYITVTVFPVCPHFALDQVVNNFLQCWTQALLV